MRPVSEKFLRTVRSTHRMRARARVVDGHQTGTTPTGTEIPIITGNVVFDSTADIRSTLDMETAGTFTTAGDGLLTPYGNEIFVERGIDYGNGQTEWVSLGYFRIDSIEQSTVPNGTLRISGSDRMAGIVDARLEGPVQFLAGTTLGAALESLVLDVYPTATIEYDFDPDANPFTSSHISDEKRYEFLLDLVRSRGKVMFWDHRGVLVVKSPPDPDTPVFTVSAGRDGVLVSASRELSRDGVYNSVVASGETADGQPPVLAVARDMSPQSATRWGGPFGKVPRFYTSPFIQTTEQAATAATALLRQSLGLPFSVDFTSVCNPALEPLDPVLIVTSVADPAGRTHILDQLTIGLMAGDALSAQTREQTIEGIVVS